MDFRPLWMEVDDSIILEQDAFRGLYEGLSVASHASDGGYRQHLKKNSSVDV